MFPLAEFVKFPVLLTQLTGTFPLSLVEQREGNNGPCFHLEFLWTGIGTIATLFRVCANLAAFWIAVQKWDLIMAFYGGQSGTINFVEVTIHSVILYGDLLCVVLLLRRRRDVGSFLNCLTNLCNHICHHVNHTTRQDAYREIFQRLKFIRRAFLVVIFLTICDFCSTCISFLQYHDYIFYGKITKIEIFILFLYAWITMQVRLFILYIPVSFLFLMQICFTALKWSMRKTFSTHKSSCIIFDEMKWTMKTFKRIEILLKQFQNLFDFQIMVGVVTILTGLLNESFEVTTLVLSAANRAEVTNWNQPISFSSMMCSGYVVIYMICDAATELTVEAQECIWSLRVYPCMNLLSEEEKGKIMQFYVEKATKPPKITPFNLFTLGRHLIPTVRQYQFIFPQLMIILSF